MLIQGAGKKLKFDTLGWCLLLLTVLVAVAAVIGGVFHERYDRAASFGFMTNAFHFAAEIASILVCCSIYLIAIFSYPFLPNTKLLTAGYTFFATGVFDALHLISHSGYMLFPFPEEISARSAVFQAVSRLLCAIGLLVTVRVAENRKLRIRSLIWFVVECVFLAACVWFIVWNPLDIVWLMPDATFSVSIRTTQYLSAVLLLVTLVLSFRNFAVNGDRVLMAMAAAISLLLGCEILAASVPPHTMYGDGLAHLLRFFGQLLLFYVFFVTGIRRPYQLLSESKDSLNRYVNELDRQVEQRTAELTRAHARLVADVEMARDVQRSMLPSVLPQGETVRFAAGYVPAEQLSGDFYDVFKIDANRFALCVGDVAGHGVSAAMLTVFAFQSVQSLLEESRGAGVILPSFVLKHLYESFNQANFRDELYMVLFYAVYNMETGILSFANGGLNTTPVRIRPDGTVQELEAEGMAICRMFDIVKPNFQNKQLLMFPGDKLVVYTDGLVDARSPSGEIYTQERLFTVLREGARLSADVLREVILHDVRAFVGQKDPGDDITLLIMEVTLPF